MDKVLEPVYFPLDDTWRTPLKVSGASYKLWVDKNFARIFSSHTLPDLVKQKLSVINAREGINASFSLLFDGVDYESCMFNIAPLIHPAKDPGPLADVGWKHNNLFYCLVLTDLEMSCMRHGVNKDSPSSETVNNIEEQT
jgi:hypothetical protein